MDRSGLFLVLSYATFLASCSGSLNRQSKQADVEYGGVIDSIYLTIRAIDLTENMSSLSSKNDELTVLVYLASDSTDQMRLLFSNSKLLVGCVIVGRLTNNRFKFDRLLSFLLSQRSLPPRGLRVRGVRKTNRDSPAIVLHQQT